MSKRPEDDSPAFTISTRGWRWISGACIVIALGAVIALVGQAALWEPDTPDGLTTLALVLAVISFFIQIVVFLFQTKTASDDLARNQELAAEASAVLNKIEATSKATQEVLFSQFDRLLDYVVDADGRPATDSTVQSDEIADAETAAVELDEEPGSGEAPVTRADLDRFAQTLSSSLAPTRPTFSARGAADPDLVKYLSTWPSREAAEDAVQQLRRLSPFGMALLTGLVSRERERGRRIRLASPKTAGLVFQELADAGFVAYDEPDELGRITDAGRAAARVLPIGKTHGERPEWWDEVTRPLRAPPTT